MIVFQISLLFITGFFGYAIGWLVGNLRPLYPKPNMRRQHQRQQAEWEAQFLKMRQERNMWRDLYKNDAWEKRKKDEAQRDFYALLGVERVEP